MTKDRYLRERGWAESSQRLHHQPWAQKQMMAFHKKQQDWEHSLCKVVLGAFGKTITDILQHQILILPKLPRACS